LKKDRNQNGIPIKDAIAAYFSALGMEDKINETGVLAKWAEISSEAVAKRTEQIYIQDQVLYIKVNSSVIRDELFSTKKTLIERINLAAGKELITDIFLK
jgi:predicted nucleic acid-binding Zn ribbon protein